MGLNNRWLTAETVELPVKNSEEFVNGSSLATFVIDDDMIELESFGFMDSHDLDVSFLGDGRVVEAG